MDINENIKILCKARGLTFADLADRLNITRQTLYRQSTGAAQLSTVERIADALAVPAFVLIHPAPLAALAIWNSAPAQAPGPAAVVLCPYCNRPIQLQAATLATAGRPSGQNTGGDPDQDKQPEEGRPKTTATDYR